MRDEFRQEYDSGRGEFFQAVCALKRGLYSGGWGHQRLEEERRRQEQDRLRTQIQLDTYTVGPGDIPLGEGPTDRSKRARSEDDEDDERRDEDDWKRRRDDD